ncbi:MAG: succinate dehydrogenase cytochrome b subunit [Cyanobacteria bacterium J06598_1]
MVSSPVSEEKKMAQPSSAADNSTKLYQSPIGKKLLTGITGIGLVTFVLIHVLGNLTLFFSATTYNQLAHFIESWGLFLYLVEFILLGLVGVHAAIGFSIYQGKRRARKAAYAEYESAGEPSRQTLASRTMVASGLLLGVFLVVHLATFKFGKVYALPGSGDRDLARLVFETFQQPTYTAGYVVVLSFLGLHLRHGIWSALQSVGIATRPGLFAGSAVLASAIALGFIGLPLAIYCGWIGAVL